VAAASAEIAWGVFFEASADRLPFGDAAFDVVVASTLFSSLPSSELESAVATEVGRVLAPGGWLVWYDLRYGNPSNQSVHGVDAKALRALFPRWSSELRSLTLLPPIARRLGLTTAVLYGPLEWLPVLRSHLIGRLRRP
jgi:ubiquinone/menaquinone biosynthesis C-methylase UbiE